MSDDAVRLNKALAAAGVASRRRADALIREGRVKVNGEVVRTLGTKVDVGSDQIVVDGRELELQDEATTILLNKPDAVITTMRDPEGRRTVRDLVAGEPMRLFAVGRLDFHTEGVLLMTTDGALANQLLHPRYKIPKVYVVKLGGRPRPEHLDRLRAGVTLEDGKTKPALVEVLEEGPRRTWIEIVITEGRNRQVRRMCEAIGHRPLRVIRTGFATFDAGKLRPGQYRYLTAKELDTLYELAGLDSPGLSERALDKGDQPLGRAERRKGLLPGESRKPAGPTPRKRKVDRRKKAKPAGGPKLAPSADTRGTPPPKAGPRKGVHPKAYRKRTSDT